MKTVEVAEATEALSAYARRVRREPRVVTRRGKPVLALVPLTDTDRENLAVSTRADGLSAVARFLQR